MIATPVSEDMQGHAVCVLTHTCETPPTHTHTKAPLAKACVSSKDMATMSNNLLL